MLRLLWPIILGFGYYLMIKRNEIGKKNKNKVINYLLLMKEFHDLLRK